MTGMIYRHMGQAVLRAARASYNSSPESWPHLHTGDADQLRAWVGQMWSRPDTVEAVTLASPSLARRIGEITTGNQATEKDIRRAATALTRYLLRETGRPTPFGTFAGAAPVALGTRTKVRWGRDHRPRARADTRWVTDIVTQLEASPELLNDLTVVLSTLCTRRGNHLLHPHGSGQVQIRRTSAVRAVERAATAPIRFAALADQVGAEFPGVADATVAGMLTELLHQGFLVSNLRAPGTATDALAHVLDQIDTLGANPPVPVADLVSELRSVHAGVDQHNGAAPERLGPLRDSLVRRMRGLSQASRTPLTVDLHLDCDVELPPAVAEEMEAAAWALLRLGATPHGAPVWRAYHAAFLARYGTGTLVPLTDVVNPDTGLGYPTGYPGAPFTPAEPPLPDSGRDTRLLALVQQAAMDGTGEIVLDEDTITRLAAGDMRAVAVPPHLEISARIHAASLEAIEAGEFTLTVSPARAAGTMTGRFTDAASDLAALYAGLPTATAGALPAQVCVPPAYPHAENVSRTPQFLPHLISLGEHREADEGAIPLDDLAVTADRDRLHLVSVSRQRVVEPLVFHGLDLVKQLPPLARFLINLPRALSATYTRFDWGAASTLPHLPRVRYRRCVLSPARWNLDPTNLPPAGAGWENWYRELHQWQRQWRMPDEVELRDQDRVLRLDLAEPAHAVLLRTHLDTAGPAVLTEAADPAGLGWVDGHAHEVAAPLVSTRAPAPSPLAGGRALVPIRADHGHLPGGQRSEWLYAKIYAHPDRHDEILATHLPLLLRLIGGTPQWWFLRYRSPHEQDHLRLRIRVTGPLTHGTYTAVIGFWAERLRRDGLINGLEFATYLPEIGRYGNGPAMRAAEIVFTADSAALLTQWVEVPDSAADRRVLAAAAMIHTAAAFTGSTAAGIAYIIDHPHAPPKPPLPRAVTDQAVRLANPRHGFAHLRGLPGGDDLLATWHTRRQALDTYRRLCSPSGGDTVLESLLHMHHIRALGVGRDSERACRRLARAAALSWRARDGQR
ncbi:thiopeptide-type bacteriocin biosynthesis protein [Murinocardiopsis flavida]|uniref:Thiopeptide-type bacteriocin biosynthesis protein n=1 Tax=Murinocardiopsis flavida TaxID=645275 RepID=A0A2P8CYB5_9ACTN|nr:lantibiotic dehydratase [Murinocardiopsis flavida]PSK89906.1 thiopeptide-type bacteriocin biosynthesis protein [Murinocardiopsis flavida]